MMFLTEEEVAALLPMEDLVPAMRHALVEFSSRRAVQPVRVVLPVAEHRGFFGVMPAYCGALGAKIVTFYPENQSRPTHQAVILLFDPVTGEPIATMDGRLITEMRTAAVSAVATDVLARPDAEVLTILGSGVQAKSHLQALRPVRPFREVRVWSPRNAGAFAARHGVQAIATPREAVHGADVVVTATSARDPVLCWEWLSPGAHVASVGANRPDWRELDDELMRRATLIVDSREATMRESGDIIAAGRTVAEIGEVLTGASPGRGSTEEVTLFKSVGLAIEDVVAADLVYQRALNGAHGRSGTAA
jgi:alanine dehydrogenase